MLYLYVPASDIYCKTKLFLKYCRYVCLRKTQTADCDAHLRISYRSQHMRVYPSFCNIVSINQLVAQAECRPVHTGGTCGPTLRAQVA